MRKKTKIDWLWDTWCICSIIGIWPRFIEPKWLRTSFINIPLKKLPIALDGLKCLQFSDLHWNSDFSKSFAEVIIKKITKLEPDLIFFTGDFICRSNLEDTQGLIKFLNSLKSTYGNFAVLGNHDYKEYVTINPEGDYDIEIKPSNHLKKGFHLLFENIKLTKKITDAGKNVGFHGELMNLLKQTNFKILNNETITIPIKNFAINITGLGEYSMDKCCPEIGFEGFNEHFPGITLVHNPDAIPKLEKFPGQLIIAGHTHGGQINLPFLWKKFTQMEQVEYKRGLKKSHNKWIYINRGIGSLIPFRWFSPPEITLFTLTSDMKNGK